MRSTLVTIVFAASLVSTVAAGSAPSSAMRGPALAVRVPLLPFAWIGSRVRGLFGHGPALENASTLRREQGWMVLDFPVNEPASALYLEVAGRVEFDSAEIVFGDGATRALDLRGAVRGRGLFELHDCAGGREVAGVRLNVRAASDRASIGLRLGRFSLTAGDRQSRS